MNRVSEPASLVALPHRPTRVRFGVLFFLCTLALVLYIDRICIGQAESTIREELKLDSVDLLSVMLRVETQLKISLNSKDFEKVVTVGDLLDVIQIKLHEAAAKKAA